MINLSLDAATELDIVPVRYGRGDVPLDSSPAVTVSHSRLARSPNKLLILLRLMLPSTLPRVKLRPLDKPVFFLDDVGFDRREWDDDVELDLTIGGPVDSWVEAANALEAFCGPSGTTGFVGKVTVEDEAL